MRGLDSVRMLRVKMIKVIFTKFRFANLCETKHKKFRCFTKLEWLIFLLSLIVRKSSIEDYSEIGMIPLSDGNVWYWILWYWWREWTPHWTIMVPKSYWWCWELFWLPSRWWVVSWALLEMLVRRVDSLPYRRWSDPSLAGGVGAENGLPTIQVVKGPELCCRCC